MMRIVSEKKNVAVNVVAIDAAAPQLSRKDMKGPAHDETLTDRP